MSKILPFSFFRGRRFSLYATPEGLFPLTTNRSSHRSHPFLSTGRGKRIIGRIISIFPLFFPPKSVLSPLRVRRDEGKVLSLEEKIKGVLPLFFFFFLPFLSGRRGRSRVLICSSPFLVVVPGSSAFGAPGRGGGFGVVGFGGGLFLLLLGSPLWLGGGGGGGLAGGSVACFGWGFLGVGLFFFVGWGGFFFFCFPPSVVSPPRAEEDGELSPF